MVSVFSFGPGADRFTGIMENTDIPCKISEINKENLPLILTGDFNSIQQDEPIKIIKNVLKDSREKTETVPYGQEGTSGGFDVKVMPNIIEYIFVNSKIRVLRYGILSDSFGLYYPSDYLPVFTELQIA